MMREKKFINILVMHKLTHNFHTINIAKKENSKI
jgi:hypothetical protein